MEESRGADREHYRGSESVIRQVWRREGDSLTASRHQRCVRGNARLPRAVCRRRRASNARLPPVAPASLRAVTHPPPLVHPVTHQPA